MVGALTAALAPYGLDLVGATSLAAYDAAVRPDRALRHLAPGARSAIVIGNGGRRFWDAFRGSGSDPGVRHPLDAYTRRVVEEVTRPLIDGQAARIVYPFGAGTPPVSFMRLAECAGLGRPSLLGVLVHPVYGPWIALRAAILVPAVVTAPRPAAGFDPCPTCVERACMTACPAGAVDVSGWDVGRCATQRSRNDDACVSACHARFACVVGRAHRHPAEALAYHQAAARPALIAAARG